MRACGIAGFHSEYVRVGPYRVHYFVGGQGTPLLLIHGLGARSEDWTPEMPVYAKNGFRVYAIDLLGCGRTDRPDIAIHDWRAGRFDPGIFDRCARRESGRDGLVDGRMDGNGICPAASAAGESPGCDG